MQKMANRILLDAHYISISISRRAAHRLLHLFLNIVWFVIRALEILRYLASFRLFPCPSVRFISTNLTLFFALNSTNLVLLSVILIILLFCNTLFHTSLITFGLFHTVLCIVNLLPICKYSALHQTAWISGTSLRALSKFFITNAGL